MILTAIFLALLQSQATLQSEAEKRADAPDGALLRAALNSGKYECQMMRVQNRAPVGKWDTKCAEALAAIEVWDLFKSEDPSFQVYVVIRPRKVGH